MKKPHFILLSDNRTGSTVIREALDSHSCLSVLDEVLCFNDPNGEQTRIRKKMAIDLYYGKFFTNLSENSDLVPFINRLFQNYNGFKLHRRNQINRANPTWLYLAQMPDLKVLFLYRKNKVRQLVSMHAARESGVWHVPSDGTLPDHGKVRIEPGYAFGLLDSWAKEEEYFRCLFAGGQMIEIVYEDIEEKIHDVLAYIQGFLGIPLESLKISYKKVTHKSVADLVANLDELRAALRGTQFERMLDE